MLKTQAPFAFIGASDDMLKLALIMRVLLSVLFTFLFFWAYGSAQDCSPPPIVFNAKTENMFTPEQEMFLGDAMMERLEKDYRVINDDAVNAHLQNIGDRISKNLPQTGIRFRFVVVDTPDTNAYAMAGGRIFVTRKLISFVRSEDELAGVIGHELGHAVVRHHATNISRYFKHLLGVSIVGDRRDVYDKYNRFLETFRTKDVKFSGNHEDKQQVEADRLGLFAVYAAGYDPNGFTSFWKRLTDAKKRNFFSELFGENRPADKRLKEMVEAMKQIPSVCIDKLAGSAQGDFEKWRKFVINHSGLGAKESLTGLLYRRQLVPLRSDIDHLRFSPNGEYFLAQDNSTLTVLRREPLSVVFRVDVEDAFPASFSADSRSLVVFNKNLRVQKWNIVDKSLTSTYEVAIRGGYWQTRISPDGNYVACYRYSGDLVIYDVATNEEVFKEREFYLPTSYEIVWWQLMQEISSAHEYAALNMEFSPDGRYLLAGGRRSVYFSRTLSEREATIAVDLTSRKKISIGDNIKTLLLTSMDFMTPDKVIGQYGTDVKKSGIFRFPDGERLAQFDLAGASFTATHDEEYVTVRPVSGAAVGLFDLTQKKFLLGNGKPALDGYGKVFVAERRDGEIGLFNVETKQIMGSIALPPSPFGLLRATALSADGNWLVVSDQSRGAAWDLRTGERKLHVRSFRGVNITPDAKAYTEFPKQGKSERSVGLMDLQTGSVTTVGDLATDANVRQHGRYMLLQKAIKGDTPKPAKKEQEKENPFDEQVREKPLPQKGVLMEMHDVQTGNLLWNREFLNERPAVVVSVIHDSMLLGWSLNSDAANQILKSDAGLKARRDKMGDKAGDQLIELVDPKTGTTKGHFLLETGEASFLPENLRWAGEYMVINDNQNRILIYSIATGELLTRLFGSYPAISSATKQIAVENSPGRVAISDISTGKELGRLSFQHPVSYMRFVQNGARLFVLTSDQTAFMFDTAKLQAARDSE